MMRSETDGVKHVKRVCKDAYPGIFGGGFFSHQDPVSRVLATISTHSQKWRLSKGCDSVPYASSHVRRTIITTSRATKIIKIPKAIHLTPLSSVKL